MVLSYHKCGSTRQQREVARPPRVLLIGSLGTQAHLSKRKFPEFCSYLSKSPHSFSGPAGARSDSYVRTPSARGNCGSVAQLYSCALDDSERVGFRGDESLTTANHDDAVMESQPQASVDSYGASAVAVDRVGSCNGDN